MGALSKRINRLHQGSKEGARRRNYSKICTRIDSDLQFPAGLNQTTQGSKEFPGSATTACEEQRVERVRELEELIITEAEAADASAERIVNGLAAPPV